MTATPTLFDDIADAFPGDLAAPSAPADAPAGDASIDDVPHVAFPIATPPKRTAVTKLADALVANGLPTRIAQAVANAVVDPAEVRQKLPFADHKRVDGAEVLIVRTRVYAPAVVPFVANPRASSKRRYPASGHTSRSPLAEIVCDPTGLPELVVHADSIEHVTEVLSVNAAHALATNDLTDSIARSGVHAEVLVVPTTFSHADGYDQATVLTAADGSSRITSCHTLLGLDPHTSLYPFAHDPAALRHVVASVAATGTNPSVAQVRRLNALEVPAAIVVGFKPHQTGTDFAKAIRSMIGSIHVDPPRPWERAGVIDAQADGVLEALAAEPGCSHAELAWVGGTLPLSDAAAAGLPTLEDERFVRLVSKLMDPDLKRVMNAGIRAVTPSKPHPSQPERLAVCVELALRAVRHENVERAAAMRAALQDGLPSTGAIRQFNYDDAFWSQTGRSPDALLTAALAELGSDTLPASTELAVLGLWWLTKHGLVTRTRGDLSTRDVFSNLHLTEHGLRTLHRAVVDGRAGQDIKLIAPDGTVELGASGQPRTLSTDDIVALIPDENAHRERAAAAAERAAAALPPEQRLHDALTQLTRRAEALPADLAAAKAILADDRPLIDAVGMQPRLVEPLRAALDTIRGDVEYYIRVHERYVAAHLPADPS
jgi:hypothetical protein